MTDAPRRPPLFIIAFFLFAIALLAMLIASSLSSWYGSPAFTNFIIVFLPLLFYVLVIAFEHQGRSNVLSRSLYVLCSLLIGLFFFAALSLIPGWLVRLLTPLDVRLVYPALVVLLVGFSLLRAYYLSVKHVRLGLPGLRRPVRVVHLSDLHLGAMRGGRFLGRVLDKVRSLRPDVLVMTGDIFDGSGSPDDVTVLPFRKLSFPVIAVLGNHDLYFGADRAQRLLEEQGVKVLRKGSVSVKGVRFVGMDCSPGAVGGTPAPALQGFDKRKAEPTVLLYHMPSGVADAQASGVHLFLAGHTHGGQLFPMSLIVRLLFPFISGLHKLGGMWLYVSSGVGAWGPPMRFLTKAEIVVFGLEKGSSPTDS